MKTIPSRKHFPGIAFSAQIINRANENPARLKNKALVRAAFIGYNFKRSFDRIVKINPMRWALERAKRPYILITRRILRLIGQAQNQIHGKDRSGIRMDHCLHHLRPTASAI
jgi:hypothetical protein